MRDVPGRRLTLSSSPTNCPQGASTQQLIFCFCPTQSSPKCSLGVETPQSQDFKPPPEARPEPEAHSIPFLQYSRKHSLTIQAGTGPEDNSLAKATRRASRA